MKKKTKVVPASTLKPGIKKSLVRAFTKANPDPLLLTTAKESEKKFFGIYREDDIGVVEGMHLGTNEAHSESLLKAIAYPSTRRRRTVFFVELKVVRVIQQFWEGPIPSIALLLLMPHAIAAIGVERWFA